MKKLQVLLTVVISAILLVGCGGADGEESSGGQSGDDNKIVIKAQTLGSEVTRVDNLVEAAKVLNEELKEEGEDIQVEVEPMYYDGSNEDYAKQFMLAHQANKEPDIYATGHEHIGWLADGGYILPLDELKDSEVYSDIIYPNLWDSVTYKGQIWAAIQDIESRPVFYNKDALKELGWSEDEINSLPERVKNGEFTLEDMTQLAEEAVEKGVTEYGIIHRPVEGPDFHYMAYNFGGTIYDAEENKIVLDKEATEKQLSYFAEVADKGLIPDNLTQMEWSNIHRTVVNGKTLFYYGGIWNIFNWGEDDYHEEVGKVDGEWVREHFGMMLVPAAEKGGKPVTLSHPYVYVVSSQTEHPEIVKRLLELVAAPELQLKHAIDTFHYPITKDVAEMDEFKEAPSLAETVYMLEYTTFLPNHEDFTTYSQAIYGAIQAVELGKKTVEEALADMETQLKNDLGDELIVKE